MPVDDQTFIVALLNIYKSQVNLNISVSLESAMCIIESKL